MKSRFTAMHWLVVGALGLGVAGCASIGRPQGGAKDQTPPEFVSSNPSPEAKNVDRNKIELFFNENVQLEDAFNKVIVSPVQKNNPSVSSNGKRVSVELKDTLLPNTTYTIDFGDAIKDLNEGNILDGFTTSFSTGDTIDTLRISGMVLEARSLEPAQGMLVGVYRCLPDSLMGPWAQREEERIAWMHRDSLSTDTLAPWSLPYDSLRYLASTDSAIYKMPLERVARTNQLGQFTIFNLKPGNYRIYALNDINRDYKWDRTEDVAFYDLTISPFTEPIEVVDTLRSWSDTDSLTTRQGIAYLPNDILLTWFNENYQSQYLKDYKREDKRRFTIQMAAPADSLPEITIAKGPLMGEKLDSWGLLKANPTRDSLEYWIRDTLVLNYDSLMLSVKYQRTDTNELLTWKTDTLKFFFKEPVDKNKEKKKKKKKDEEEADTVPEPVKINFMTFSAVTGSSQELNLPLIFKADQPIDTFYEDTYKLEILDDTLWYPIDGVKFVVDSLLPLTQRRMAVEWEEGEKYRLTIDSAAVVGIYGEWNNTVKHEFTVKKSDDYSTLSFNVAGLDSLPAIVELLDKSEKILAKANVVEGVARLPYLKPGTVYARLFIDANGNGEWDTGNLKEAIQPEEVYYYPKKINLKQNWDIAQDWNIYDVAIDMQKPNDIKKNKPKLKKGERQQQYDDEEEEEEDYWGNGYYGSGNNNANYGRTNNTSGFNRNTY